MAPSVVYSRDFPGDAARWILTQAEEAIGRRKIFRLALAGGNTPRRVHAQLAQLGASLDWERVFITFGDERCVRPDHPESNYQMARSSLFDHLPIPPANILRIRGEIDPEAAARECEAELARLAATRNELRYIHDLILLGMGPDGHTASLFPGSPALNETTRSVVAARGPKPPPQRVTFTFPLINAARQICFLIDDAAKEPMIDEIIAGRSELPAARVQPSGGTVTWLIAAGARDPGAGCAA